MPAALDADPEVAAKRLYRLLGARAVINCARPTRSSAVRRCGPRFAISIVLCSLRSRI